MIRKAIPVVVLMLSGCSYLPEMPSWPALPSMDSFKNVFKTSSDDIYSNAPCDLVASRYNNAIDEMQAKVTESWEQLQPSSFSFMPTFLGGPSHSAKSAQDVFIANYNQYYSASRELGRCGIRSRPLSDVVKTVAKNLGMY